MEHATTLLRVEAAEWQREPNAPPKDGEAALIDEQLVRKCLDGDQEAWSGLIDRYRNLIFSIPIRQGLPRDDASEIFQQVCLKLVSELPRLREIRSLPAWLIRVTTHECFHWRRQHDRRFLLEPILAAEEPTGPFEVAGDMLVELEREQALRESVAGLADRCQRLIQLLFFTVPAPSYEEVARTLAIAKGSVGFIRMRCLERLRKSLQARGFC